MDCTCVWIGKCTCVWKTCTETPNSSLHSSLLLTALKLCVPERAHGCTLLLTMRTDDTTGQMILHIYSYYTYYTFTPAIDCPPLGQHLRNDVGNDVARLNVTIVLM